jgi:hypothetical protein
MNGTVADQTEGRARLEKLLGVLTPKPVE